MSKPKFTRDDRRLLYAMRQYSFLLVMSDLAGAIQAAQPSLDERTGNLLQACWMALFKLIPVSPAAGREAHRRYNEGERYPYHPAWLETDAERRERWREEQASQPQEPPRKGRDRPSRQEYRELFRSLSKDEQEKLSELLFLALQRLLGAPCPAEEPAEQPQEEGDAGVDDVWLDVWKLDDLEFDDD